jgi:hypothetical protein
MFSVQHNPFLEILEVQQKIQPDNERQMGAVSMLREELPEKGKDSEFLPTGLIWFNSVF